jgi:hypothetical protein
VDHVHARQDTIISEIMMVCVITQRGVFHVPHAQQFNIFMGAIPWDLGTVLIVVHALQDSTLQGVVENRLELAHHAHQIATALEVQILLWHGLSQAARLETIFPQVPQAPPTVSAHNALLLEIFVMELPQR